MEENNLSLLREKGNHPRAKRKTQHLKHQHRIIKFTQNAFVFTLIHYNASHDRGRTRHQYVTSKWPQREKTTILIIFLKNRHNN